MTQVAVSPVAHTARTRPALTSKVRESADGCGVGCDEGHAAIVFYFPFFETATDRNT